MELPLQPQFPDLRIYLHSAQQTSVQEALGVAGVGGEAGQVSFEL